ncbi:hypothetical protein J6P11_01095 [bacterium]|nr:hypothetical protein [bacterium]
MQIVDFDIFVILDICLDDNLDFFIISLSIFIKFSSPSSANLLNIFATSSSPSSLTTSFQISSLVFEILGLPNFFIFLTDLPVFEINIFISLL